MQDHTPTRDMVEMVILYHRMLKAGFQIDPNKMDIADLLLLLHYDDALKLVENEILTQQREKREMDEKTQELIEKLGDAGRLYS